MEAAPNTRTMIVPPQRRVVGAERSTWQEEGLLPEGYAYICLGGQFLTLNGAFIIMRTVTP